MPILTGTLDSGVIDIFDLTTDSNGNTKFVRRGSTTGTGH